MANKPLCQYVTRWMLMGRFQGGCPSPISLHVDVNEALDALAAEKLLKEKKGCMSQWEGFNLIQVTELIPDNPEPVKAAMHYIGVTDTIVGDVCRPLCRDDAVFWKGTNSEAAVDCPKCLRALKQRL